MTTWGLLCAGGAGVVVTASFAIGQLEDAASDPEPTAPLAVVQEPDLVDEDGVPIGDRAQQRGDVGPILVTPLATWERGMGSSLITQVNVDGSQGNILFDAGNEPSIAVDPTAPIRMAIGWRQFDSVSSSFRQAGNAFSVDGGRTWTNQTVIQPGVFRSDPVLGVDGRGTFYYNSLRGDFAVHIFKSDDAGDTWGPEIPAFGGDKQWMAITQDITTPTHLYMAWNTAAGCCGILTFTRSLDFGETWISPVGIPMSPIFGTTALGPNEEVYVVGVASRPFFDASTIVVAKSSNASNPAQLPFFEQVTTVDMGGSVVLGAGPNPSGLLGQPHVLVDESGGTYDGSIYVIGSFSSPSGDPLDVRVARSDDAGMTWGMPVTINDDGPGIESWQWLGTASIAPNGRLDVVWCDTRNDRFAQTSQLFYSFSLDGGQTWSVNQVMTPPFNHSLGYPQQSKMGDYFHMVSDNLGADLAFAGTFNGEQDVYYMRLGPFDCNRNEISDAFEIAMGDVDDCNENGIPDECEVTAGVLVDENMDGVFDACEIPCDADLNGDGVVGSGDISILIGSWGSSGVADLDGDGNVSSKDLAELLGRWGPCP